MEVFRKMLGGQTIVEKIVSRATGKKVSAGELVEVLPIDKLYFNEVIAPPALVNFKADFDPVFEELASNSQKEIVVFGQGMKSKLRVFDPKRVCFIPDHTVPSCSVKVAQGVNLMKQFASENGIRMYKEGDGIEHTVVTEEGFVRPGEVVVATDSHTDTVGAIGALGFGIGTTEAEYALALGEIYDFFVPESYKFEINGDFQNGVSAKDLILHILGTLKEGGCSKRVAEYTGNTMRKMGMDGRFTMCNMSVEMSARSGIVNPDEVTLDFMQDIVRRHPELSFELSESMKKLSLTKSDDNAEYSSKMEIDAATMIPQVALPHSPANAKPASELNDEVNVVFIGSCTNARHTDLIEAAKVIKGRKVSSNVNLIVIPASRLVYNWAMSEGILKIFADAGANIESSNCGPCFGKHMGVLSPGDRCVSTSNRNYKGRMGSPEASIYLASPATAAATAIEGKITDPRRDYA
ncbi:MAG: 3-isopropylmalate dehydratase large subunit [Nitrososphaerota archaeon]|nr:3-isopropylmalate dehydratase large subunit [Nitrososphaerota archaeon]